MNPDIFNMSVRKFLKSVGVQSQREIETVVAAALTSGKLQGGESLPATMTLKIGGINHEFSVDGLIELG